MNRTFYINERIHIFKKEQIHNLVFQQNLISFPLPKQLNVNQFSPVIITINMGTDYYKTNMIKIFQLIIILVQLHL